MPFVPFVSLVGPVSGTNVTSSTTETVTMSMFMTVVGWMLSMSDPLHYSLEASVRSWPVFHHPGGTVGFLKGVPSGHVVAIPLFVLGLDVVGVGVVDAIFELVVGMILEKDVVKGQKKLELSKMDHLN